MDNLWLISGYFMDMVDIPSGNDQQFAIENGPLILDLPFENGGFLNSGKPLTMERSTMLFMGKSTISGHFQACECNYPVVNGGSDQRSVWGPIFPIYSLFHGKLFGAT